MGLSLNGLAVALRAATGFQAADTLPTARDTVRLPELEARSTLAPVARSTVGSGVPARLATLHRNELAARARRTVAEAVASLAGVALYDDLGTPYKPNLTSRGFAVGATVGLPAGFSVFLDGVRQNEPDAAEVSFDLLPVEHLERVELLQGAGSLLGPNSLAGALNLVTRRGAGPLAGEVATAAGSFGSLAVRGAAGSSTGAWDQYVAGGWQRERGWREAAGAERYHALVNVGHRREASLFRLRALVAGSRAETAGSLPESIFRVAPRTNFTAGDFEDVEAQQLSLSASLPAAGGIASVTLHGRRSYAVRFNVNQAPDNNVRGTTRNHTAGLSLDWRAQARAAPGGLAFRLGADLAVHRVRVFLDEEAFDDPAARARTTDVASPGWDVAAYALADVVAGPVTASAGLRLDHVVIPFQDRLDPAADTVSRFSRVSVRAGVSGDLGDGSSVYASVGQAFRAPAILELACADPEAACPLPFALGDDPPLDPVVATTAEVGWRGELGTLVQVTGSAYATWVRNEIFFVASDVARLAGYFTNLGRTRREGIELSATVGAGRRASGSASWAWTRATFRSAAQLFSIRAEDELDGEPLAGRNEVVPGDRLPVVPAHLFTATGRAELLRNVTLELDGRYTGAQWLRGDEANETTPLDGYVVVNARLAVARGPWLLAARVSNLFDATAATFGTFNENRATGRLERFLTPLETRAVAVEVRRRLGGSP